MVNGKHTYHWGSRWPDQLSAKALADQGHQIVLHARNAERNGTLRQLVTIWVVRQGDDLYVRSYKGRAGAWFLGTQMLHEGQIQAGGIAKDITFVEETDPAINDQIDAAYRTKYHRYGARYVDPMFASTARNATLKLVPRATTSF